MYTDDVRGATAMPAASPPTAGGVLNCGTRTNPQFCGEAAASRSAVAATASCPTAASPARRVDVRVPGLHLRKRGGRRLRRRPRRGTCADPQYCGGGGYSKCGGNNGLTPDGSVACTPETCSSLGYTCGVAGNGCGGTVSCGSCTDPQYCGGGGYNKCGGNNGLTADGSVACTPKTCGQLGYTCGITGDGCGASLNCGSCTNPQYCGGGGFNLCGGNNGFTPDGGVACTPSTCATLGYNCGQAADGCGGLLNCGSCSNPEFCGGAAGYMTTSAAATTASRPTDGVVPARPATCAQLSYTCGAAGDGCGNLINCGTCTSPQYCGGGGYDLCGPTTLSVCDGGATTSVTGFVYDPGNTLPIYNALVYVPIGAPPTPQTGVNPAVCGCISPAGVRLDVHRHRRQLHAERAEQLEPHARRPAGQMAACVQRDHQSVRAQQAHREL